MKRTLIVLTVTLTALSLSFAQVGGRAPSAADAASSGTIPLGLGATVIDGKTFYLVNLRPDLSFGKLGFGLDLNLRVGTDGTIRKEDYDEGYDYLRMVRYVRWGHKGDDLYIRLGQLDYARLGHGSIIYNYNNSPSYELRKVGLALDVNLEKFGAEMLYSDFGGAGLFGIRGYVKPLKFTSLAKLPVVNNMEVGATIASDFHDRANSYRHPTLGAFDNGSMTIMGLDLGLPIIDYPIFKSGLYLDFAAIGGYGSGIMTGITFDFSGLGLVTIGGKYERQWFGDQFVPSYFDALYELERFTPIDSVNYTSKANALKQAKGREAYYGEIVIGLLGVVDVVGGYTAPVGVKNQGTIHLELLTADVLPLIQLKAGYDKRNVGSVFKVDNNSVLHAEVGYKPYPFMIVSMLYQWTFAEEKNDLGQVTGYKTQKRVEPKVSFVFTF